MKVRPSRTFRPGWICVTAWTMLPQKPIAPALSSVSATCAPPSTPAIGGATASELIDLPPPWIDARLAPRRDGQSGPLSIDAAKLLSFGLVHDGFDRRTGAAPSPHLRYREQVCAHRLPRGLRFAGEECLVDPPVCNRRLRHRVDQVRDAPAHAQELAHRVEHEREHDVPRRRRDLTVEVDVDLEVGVRVSLQILHPFERLPHAGELLVG